MAGAQLALGTVAPVAGSTQLTERLRTQPESQLATKFLPKLRFLQMLQAVADQIGANGCATPVVVGASVVVLAVGIGGWLLVPGRLLVPGASVPGASVVVPQVGIGGWLLVPGRLLVPGASVPGASVVVPQVGIGGGLVVAPPAVLVVQASHSGQTCEGKRLLTASKSIVQYPLFVAW